MLTEEQRLARKDKITASNVGAILGLSPYATPDDVMREMVREHFGAEREFIGNLATQWGNDHEAEAILALEGAHDLFVQRSDTIVHPGYRWLAATPDGLVDGDIVVEVKCPYNKKLFNLYNRIDYVAQIQTQMACSGRRRGWFGVWTPDDFHSEFVTFDDNLFDAWMPLLQTFYDSYLDIIADPVLAEPYLADMVQDMSADPFWPNATARYLAISAQIKDLEGWLSKYRTELIERANGRKSQGCGVTVYPIKPRVTTDYKAIVASNCPDIDVAPYTKTGTPSWGIKPSKGE